MAANATELLRRAADALRSELGPVPPYYIYGLIQEMEEHFFAAVPEAEPVAQVSMTNSSKAYVTAPNIPPGTLLYRHPPRPEQLRKPMTEEEINRELPFECSGIYFDGFRAGVHFAEKHHGLGGDE